MEQGITEMAGTTGQLPEAEPIVSRTWTHRLLVVLLMLCGGIGALAFGVHQIQNADVEDPHQKLLEQFSADKIRRAQELERIRVASLQASLRETQPTATEVDPEPAPVVAEPRRFARPSVKRRHFSQTSDAIEGRLLSDVEYLSSDELEGRGVRTAGLQKAGEFIAQQFAAAGLEMAGEQHTPYQEFQLFNGSHRGAVQRVLFQHSSEEKFLLTPNVDFSSLIKTTMGTMTLPVTFVGYGITAPELNYDDYQQMRVRGHAVVVLRHEPQQDSSESPFNGTSTSRYSPVYSKVQNAIRHGAAAVILCNTAEKGHDETSGDLFSSNLLKVEFAENAFETSVPVIHCRRELITKIMQDAGLGNLEELENAIDDDLQPRSSLIPDFKIGFEVTKNRTGRTVSNVLACLDPIGLPASATVIVG